MRNDRRTQPVVQGAVSTTSGRSRRFAVTGTTSSIPTCVSATGCTSFSPVRPIPTGSLSGDRFLIRSGPDTLAPRIGARQETRLPIPADSPHESMIAERPGSLPAVPSRARTARHTLIRRPEPSFVEPCNRSAVRRGLPAGSSAFNAGLSTGPNAADRREKRQTHGFIRQFPRGFCSSSIRSRSFRAPPTSLPLSPERPSDGLVHKGENGAKAQVNRVVGCPTSVGRVGLEPTTQGL